VVKFELRRRDKAEMSQMKRNSRQVDESRLHPVKEAGVAASPVWKFRLYIAGDAPQSRVAQSNIEDISRQYLEGQCQIEVIDLLREPQSFLKDDILVTPTLVRYTPEPICTLIGNLSNRQEVLLALGLKE
jgi:circadian clock protein KaiB